MPTRCFHLRRFMSAICDSWSPWRVHIGAAYIQKCVCTINRAWAARMLYFLRRTSRYTVSRVDIGPQDSKQSRLINSCCMRRERHCSIVLRVWQRTKAEFWTAADRYVCRLWGLLKTRGPDNEGLLEIFICRRPIGECSHRGWTRPLAARHLPCGPVGPPARWAATSNVEV